MHSSIFYRSIESAELDDAVAFNQQLKQLVFAGVPIRWPGYSDSESTVSQAEQTIKEIAFRVTQGDSLPDLLRNDKTIPEPYKLSFTLWYVSGGSLKAFDILKSLQLQSPVIQQRWSWFFYLKILIALAIMSFGIWQSTGGAALRELYTASSFPPGPVGRIVIAIDQTIWAPIASLAFPLQIALFAVVLAILFSDRLWKRNSASQRRVSLAEADSQALYRSTFLSKAQRIGLSIESATSLLTKTAGSTCKQFPEENMPSDAMQIHAIHWHNEERLVKSLNRSSVRNPFLIYALVGGIIVLLIALGVFVPLWEFIGSLDSEKRF